MSNVKWIKITTDIFDDEAIQLIEQLPDGDTILIIWFKLLIKAGQINDGGLIYFKKDIPYTDEMLATVLRKPINTIRLALQTFVKFGMIEITNQEQILIRNWEKHQNIDGLERIKEQTRIRVAKHREKQKQLCNVTSNVTVTHSNALDIDKEKEKELDKEYLNIFLKNYEKVFLNIPLIDENMKKKMVEILENNPQIIDKLEDIFRKLQKEEFYFKDGTKFKPNLTWLLKDSNFIKFANGEMVTQKVKQIEASNIYEMSKRIEAQKEKERQQQGEENKPNLHTREELTDEQREKISKTIEKMRNFKFKGV